MVNSTRVCIVGHFATGSDLLNGQTIKTKIIYDELVHQLGTDEVRQIDTHGGAKVLPKCFFQLGLAFRNCKNIIMLPAQNGVQIFAPLFVFWNGFFHRKLHYVVIGGWLPEFLRGHHFLVKSLNRFDSIYVETATMKRELENQGFRNVSVLPNCKELTVLSENELVFNNTPPFKLCTFSRVMKEKGIEDAIRAVKAVNHDAGKTVYELDIYGQIEPTQAQWFQQLRQDFPEYIRYGGMVPFNQSVEVLKNYFALLFPTYYEGEGFAGTLIDAMAAGVPIIASDWRYNREIVNSRTGVLCHPQNINDYQMALEDIQKNCDKWNSLKPYCVDEAKQYSPTVALNILIRELA